MGIGGKGRKLCVISSYVPPNPNPYIGPMTDRREQAFTGLEHKLTVDAKVRDATAVPGDFNAHANRTEPERRKLISAADEQFLEGGVFRTRASRRQETWRRRDIDHIALNEGPITREPG